MRKLFYLPENGKVREVLTVDNASTEHQICFIEGGFKYKPDYEIEKLYQFDNTSRFREDKRCVGQLRINADVNLAYDLVIKNAKLTVKYLELGMWDKAEDHDILADSYKEIYSDLVSEFFNKN